MVSAAATSGFLVLSVSDTVYLHLLHLVQLFSELEKLQKEGRFELLNCHFSRFVV